MLVTTTDVSQFKETQQRQEEQIRRLQTAFGQTSKQLWEVDVSSLSAGYTQDGQADTLTDSSCRFPDDLIASGWIHPDSVARFQSFARDLLRGHSLGFGNFAIRSKRTNCYRWAAISYRMLYDDVGRAVRAVGVLEELPMCFSGVDSWSPDQHPLPEGLLSDLIMRMRADLELDKVDFLWIEGSDLSGQVQDTRCSEILRLERENDLLQRRPGALPLQFRPGQPPADVPAGAALVLCGIPAGVTAAAISAGSGISSIWPRIRSPAMSVSSSTWSGWTPATAWRG